MRARSYSNASYSPTLALAFLSFSLYAVDFIFPSRRIGDRKFHARGQFEAEINLVVDTDFTTDDVAVQYVSSGASIVGDEVEMVSGYVESLRLHGETKANETSADIVKVEGWLVTDHLGERRIGFRADAGQISPCKVHTYLYPSSRDAVDTRKGSADAAPSVPLQTRVCVRVSVAKGQISTTFTKLDIRLLRHSGTIYAGPQGRRPSPPDSPSGRSSTRWRTCRTRACPTPSCR